MLIFFHLSSEDRYVLMVNYPAAVWDMLLRGCVRVSMTRSRATWQHAGTSPGWRVPSHLLAKARAPWSIPSEPPFTSEPSFPSRHPHPLAKLFSGAASWRGGPWNLRFVGGLGWGRLPGCSLVLTPKQPGTEAHGCRVSSPVQWEMVELCPAARPPPASLCQTGREIRDFHSFF